jgi:AraC-like DNA-binding protein
MAHDLLSDLLRTVRLSGAVFFDVDASAPWVAAAPPSRSIASMVLPGAQHVIEYHVLSKGSGWARLTDRDDTAVRLSAGSVVVFPHGDAHILSSAPDLNAPADLSPFERMLTPEDLPFRLRHGKAGASEAQFICGFLGCDSEPFNPLLAALPRLLHVGGAAAAHGLLGRLIEAALKESRAPRAGSGGVLSKLSELIFAEAIRVHAESLPEHGPGWLAAMRDPGIGRALVALHAEPGRSWTVADIARTAGMSRTVLAGRFAECLGMPPMTYLLRWRMQVAATRLATTAVPLPQVASEVGYSSEAAFSRAFKRSTGSSPGAWRSQSMARPQGPTAEPTRFSGSGTGSGRPRTGSRS